MKEESTTIYLWAQVTLHPLQILRYCTYHYTQVLPCALYQFKDAQCSCYFPIVIGFYKVYAFSRLEYKKSRKAAAKTVALLFPVVTMQ